MQRETHALKRMYQHHSSHESLHHTASTGADHAVGKGNSPAGEGAVDPEGPVPDWLTRPRGKPKMTNAEKGDRIAARQLPQVHCLVSTSDSTLHGVRVHLCHMVLLHWLCY